MKSSKLPENKRKKVHITPAQQMLKRFEALQKATNSSSNAAAEIRCTSAGSNVTKQHSEGKVFNSTTVCNNTKLSYATKPKLGARVAHKPTLVRVVDRFFTLTLTC